ncbi:alpha/beta hydrolase [Pseudomonas sp.]|uniref:alpha/beta hydrolase n=1 Tax=Pseudomonas sp. TaxID=306 RepID=UPI003D1289B6
MKGPLLAIALCLLVLLPACSGVPTPALRAQQTLQLAQQAQWQPQVLETSAFQLQAFVPAQWQADAPLTLYIEGDGLAWLTSSQPSTDPTPVNPLALRLALAQPQGNAAYLARPCQFLADQPSCQRRYWTDARFSEDVVTVMNQALEQLKGQAKARELVLVGYSGGAAIALLLAARRDDVRQVITVAGNLDHAAWTAHHKVSPLHRSLNPADQRQALTGLEQVHLVGERDRITPPELARQFVAAFPPSAPQRVQVVPGYDHGCCWAQGWAGLWRAASTFRP